MFSHHCGSSHADIDRRQGNFAFHAILWFFFTNILEKTLLRPQFGHFGRKWPCRGAKIMMFLLTLISLPCRKYQNDDDEEEEDCEDYDIRDNGNNHFRPGQPQSTR